MSNRTKNLGSMILACVYLQLLGSGCGATVELPAPSGPSPAESPHPSAGGLKIRAISPAAGINDGNVFVLIEGEGFPPEVAVLFGDTPAENVNVVNEGLITLTTPQLALGFTDVTLQANDGRSITQVAAFESIPQFCMDQADADGDGRTNCEEKLGYEIWTDAFGLGFGVDTFGNVTRFTVTSNPQIADTDGDGLNDLEEFQNKCNPRVGDSDGDGLGDWEEVRRWLTSPVSMDTDGDARGPGGDSPPNAALFDGNELKTVGFTKTTDLFFSEYVEGSDNDPEEIYVRALEIYNGTDQPVVLGDLTGSTYSVVTHRPQYDEPLRVDLVGTIEPGDVFVLGSPSGIPSHVVDQFDILDFQGAEAVTLEKDGAVIDAIGTTPIDQVSPGDASRVAIEIFAIEGAIYQSFKAGRSGRLSRISIPLRNASSTPVDIDLEVTEGSAPGGPFVGRYSGQVPPTPPDVLLEYVNFNWTPTSWDLENVIKSGTDYVWLVRNNPQIFAYARLDDPYPRGAAHFNFDADFEFRTEVLPLGDAWGRGDTTTRDHTLRRSPGICSGDPVHADGFDPAKEWIGFPIDTLNDLGRHAAACPQRIVAGGTSPTLDDTDGDGRTDYEELDDPLRSNLIAQLPQIDLSFEGLLTMQLNVTYAEAKGQTFTYGSEYSQTKTTSESRTDSKATQKAYEGSVSITVGAEAEVGLPPSATVSTEVTGTYTGSTANTETSEITKESSSSAQQSFSEAQSDSREMSQETSGGYISQGMRVTNTGLIPYTLSNLSVTMLRWEPGVIEHDPRFSGEFRTLATLVPVGVEEFTVAPGESIGPFQIEDGDVNADLIRSFLRQPNRLFYDVSTFDLANEEGIDYDFLTQNTFGRTGLVVIDYGDGRVERYQVATNVNRNPDSSFAGITMRQVMEDVLHLGRGVDYETRVNSVSGIERLYRVRDLATTVVDLPGGRRARAFWTVFVGPGVDPARDFDDIVLKHGDSIYLTFIRDGDGDGVLDRQEFVHGTADDTEDSDGDLLADREELQGWTVTVGGSERTVRSDPRVADADRDGLSDRDEYLGKDTIAPGRPGDTLDATDPNDPDTDGDGFADGEDAAPLHPAGRLYVNQTVVEGATLTGLSWTNAFLTVEQATILANDNNSDGDPTNDIAEIWVAKGIYEPASTIQIVGPLRVYGGFFGGEERRVERIADPFLNGTVITSVHTVELDGAGSLLDGFTVSNSYDRFAVYGYAGFTIRNLVLTQSDIGLLLPDSGDAFVENCHFLNNQQGALALGSGGFEPLNVRFTDCSFRDNHNTTLGGAALSVEGANATATFTRCSFLNNGVLSNTTAQGGALLVRRGARVVLESCLFRGNRIEGTQAWGSAVALYGAGSIAMTNCLVDHNEGKRTDPAQEPLGAVQLVYDGNNPTVGTISVTNCTIAKNLNTTEADESTLRWGPGLAVAQFGPATRQLVVRNSILALNRDWYQIYTRSASGADVRGSFIEFVHVTEATWLSGNGNIIATDQPFPDPHFVDPNNDDFRLKADSMVIDRGLNFVDIDPFQAGVQLLPQFDLGGLLRLQAGKPDGLPLVDMGAYEFPTPAAPID